MPSSGIQPGDVIGGNLFVERKLGAGAMAEVFQVHDVTDGTRHALKVLTDPDEQQRKRILKEGELIAALDSPHVVQMRGELRVQGKPGLLMELVRGPTLSDVIKNADLSVRQALTVFRGMAMGVGTAHAMGVVHRDLKPGNVLLHVRGNAVIPKVVDFGVAKDLVDGQGLTVRGTAYGTPHYMAPEQLDDSSTVDRRADMWSLGCILYQMLCGKLPFGSSRQKLLLNVMLGRYEHPAHVRDDLPEEVTRAIEQLLVVDPADRLPDVPSLFEVLEGRRTGPPSAHTGPLPVQAPVPHTEKPTALKLSTLPGPLRQLIEVRADEQSEARTLAPSAPFTPAPAPPKSVASTGSLLPRTMDPVEIDKLKQATGTPAQVRRVGSGQPAQPRSAEPEQSDDLPLLPILATVWLGICVLMACTCFGFYWGASP